MINILCALKCEARPLVNMFRLDRIQGSGPHELYRNQGMQLLVSGPGKTASAAATAFAYAYAGMRDSMAWLNIGIAGHRQRQPGEAALINKITDGSTRRSWYPPIVFSPQSDTENLVTVDREETEFASDAMYDMEAAGFYDTACRYATAELVQCYKIVSDNARTSTGIVSAKTVSALVEAHLPGIEYIVDELDKLTRQLARYNDIPACYQVICDRWHFSSYQQNQLRRLLKKWAVQSGDDSNVDENILAQLHQCKDSGKVLHRLEAGLRNSMGKAI